MVTVRNPDPNRVPESIGRTPQIRTRAPISAAGGGQEVAATARAVQEELGAVGQFVAQERQKAADIRMLSEERAHKDWWAAGIDAPKNSDGTGGGARNLLGETARGLTPQILGEYDKWAGQRFKELATSEQKQAFRTMSARWRGKINAWSSGHEFNQIKNHEIGELKSSISAAQLHAGTDPLFAGLEVAQIKVLTQMLGEAEGAGKSQIELDIQINQAVAHENTVTRLVADNMGHEAATYLEKHKDQMSPGFAASLRSSVDKANDLAAVQGAFDTLKRQTGGFVPRMRDMAATEFRDNPELRRAVETRIDKFATRQRNDKAEVHRGATKRVIERIDAAKKSSSIFAGGRVELTGEDIVVEDLMSRADAIFTFSKEEIQKFQAYADNSVAQTDPEFATGVRSLALNDSFAFRQRYPDFPTYSMDVLSKVSPSDRDEFVKLWEGAVAAEGRQPSSADIKLYTEHFMGANGILLPDTTAKGKAGWTNDQRRAYQNGLSTFNNRFIELPENATVLEKKTMFDDINTHPATIVTSGFFSGRQVETKPAVSLTKEEAANQIIPFQRVLELEHLPPTKGNERQIKFGKELRAQARAVYFHQKGEGILNGIGDFASFDEAMDDIQFSDRVSRILFLWTEQDIPAMNEAMNREYE